MKVKITKCDNKRSWYAKRVGEVFEVEPFSDNYFIVSETRSGIYKADTEVVNESASTTSIPKDLYDKLKLLGFFESDSTRSHNVGKSDYSKHIIQPWAIWQDYNLNPWDADIIKRVLRNKDGEDRKMDYRKIIHICQERIRQIETR